MRRYKRKLPDYLFDGLNLIFLLFVVFITVYPFWYILVGSFSPITQIIREGLLLWPEEFRLDAYQTVLKNPLIPRSYGNTIFITVVGTSFSMVLTILGAYALSKKYLPGKTFLTLMVIITMLFNGGLIPTYLTVKGLGFGDSLWTLIIPSALSPFNMIVMRNFMAGIPPSLEESASIDGASHWTILSRIYLPLSMSVIATIALFYAVGYWNAFFNAIIYISNKDFWPVQVILREALVAGRTDDLMRDGVVSSPPETMKMALVIITVVPILLVYPFIQKYFVKGIMVGSLKG